MAMASLFLFDSEMESSMLVEVFFKDSNPGVITKWKIQEGRRVTENDILCEYKTSTSQKIKTPFAGLVTKILKKEKETVQSGDVLAIIEKCSHTTVWRNVCADCGMMIEGRSAGPSTKFVAMMHCVPDLLVSEENAKQLGKKDKNVLLQRKRLALLVDLDQTIIHTTNDNVPPNLKDVYHFQLQHGREGKKWWYHTKLRPHTESFLKNISEYYELHICTFGVRSYAHAIAGYLDPERKYFQHRILSRDECFHPNLKTLNLKNLFPCGDSMVCIIDDREDVWKSAPNMIRVKPYSFFDGSADINAPPLAAKSGQMKEKEPRKQNIIRVPIEKCEPVKEDDKNSEEKTEVEGAKDESTEFTELIEWEDDDDYLLHLEKILIGIHASFYKQYESNQYNLETCNLDLKSIIPEEKKKVLCGCRILFSGVIPLKQKLETSWAYRLAENFGAEVQTELAVAGEGVTTHVIGMRDGTEKIKKAYKNKIFVVNVDWLLDSIERWEKVDENLYPISNEPSNKYMLYCVGGDQQPVVVEEEEAPQEMSPGIDEKWRSEILDLCKSAVDEMSDDSDDEDNEQDDKRDEAKTRKRCRSEDSDDVERVAKRLNLEPGEENSDSEEENLNSEDDSDRSDENDDYFRNYDNNEDDCNF